MPYSIMQLDVTAHWADNLHQNLNVSQGGITRRAQLYMAGQAIDYARAYTPVITGTLQRSHEVIYEPEYGYQHKESSALWVRPFDTVINPITYMFPSSYAPKVHDRKPFYDNVVIMHGQEILRNGANYLITEFTKVANTPPTHGTLAYWPSLDPFLNPSQWSTIWDEY